MGKIFLGFDFGLKHIGVAVGQEITMTATPLPTIMAFEVNIWHEIAKLIDKWHPEALIVGVPLRMDEAEQPITKLAQDFANQLRNLFKLPTHEIDERLSTKEAREEIFRLGGYKALQKEQIDSIAAKIILESWFHENIRHE